jgi:ribosomal protein L29
MAKKIENLKEMNKDELKAKFLVLQETIRANRFKAEGSKSKNVKETASLKKQVARILTEMNKKK